MKREVTNEQLRMLELNAEKLKREFPLLNLILDNKIKQLFRNPSNQLLFKIMNKRVHEIQKKYIVHDENNVPVHLEDMSEWQYLPTAIDKNGELVTDGDVAKAYHEEYNEFAKRTVLITI